MCRATTIISAPWTKYQKVSFGEIIFNLRWELDERISSTGIFQNVWKWQSKWGRNTKSCEKMCWRIQRTSHDLRARISRPTTPCCKIQSSDYSDASRNVRYKYFGMKKWCSKWNREIRSFRFPRRRIKVSAKSVNLKMKNNQLIDAVCFDWKYYKTSNC